MKAREPTQANKRIAIAAHEFQRIFRFAGTCDLRLRIQNITDIWRGNERKQQAYISPHQPVLHRECRELIIKVAVKNDYAAHFTAHFADDFPQANEIKQVQNGSPDEKWTVLCILILAVGGMPRRTCGRITLQHGAAEIGTSSAKQGHI